MIVAPFKAVGDLFFSDKRSEIRKKINAEFTTGARANIDYKDNYDYFISIGLFIYYDKDDNVNAFEFFKPNPIFNGLNLLTEPFNNLIKIFLEIDPDLNCNDYEFTSNKYGIGGNSSNDPNGGAPPDSVIVFKRGYYDLLQEYIDKMLQNI